jgi:hypothetical protein
LRPRHLPDDVRHVRRVGPRRLQPDESPLLGIKTGNNLVYSVALIVVSKVNVINRLMLSDFQSFPKTVVHY